MNEALNVLIVLNIVGWVLNAIAYIFNIKLYLKYQSKTKRIRGIGQ